jgi:WD40 repeat protein
MERDQCPSRAELAAFSLGDLPETVLEEIAAHLDRCPRCEDTARALDQVSDGLITSLRGQPELDPTSTAPTCAAPRRIGCYEVLGELGQGGMAVVYRARHATLERVVALKMMHGGGPARPDERARFHAEARAVARLQHPNIVQLFESGEWEGRPYFALEFVDGQNLGGRLAGKPIPPAQSARWLATLARAVHYAHEQGIVHRDLKPSNVLLTPAGDLKLCDFGVAKLLTGSAVQTSSGLLVGTPEYMAPEQARGLAGTIGPPADLHALGAILYTMLTGRPPFQSAELHDTLDQIRTQDPVPPRRLQPTVPRDLETICLKCLEKESLRRYASAGALADDLERFLAGRTILARPSGPVERAWKWARGRPTAAALVLLSLLLVGIGLPALTMLWLQADHARDEEARARADEARARGEEARQRRLAQRAFYYSQIALAQQRLEADSVQEAANWLAGCPAALRAWEWRYLERQCHPEQLTVPPTNPEFWAHDVGFSPDGRRFVAATGLIDNLVSHAADAHQRTPGRAAVHDAADGRLDYALAGPHGAVWSAAFSPDGRWLACGSADGSVWLAKAAGDGRRCLQPLRAGDQVRLLRFSPDGRWLAVNSERAIRVWELPAGRLKRLLPHSPGHTAMTFRHDGCLLGNDPDPKNPRLFLWDLVADRAVPHSLPAGTYQSLAFSPDDRLLALVRRFSSRVEVWDVVGSRLVHELSGHPRRVNILTFGPDSRLATGSDDGTVRLWAPESGQQLLTLRGHAAGVLSLAFSSDGRRLVSGSKDGTVKSWDVTRDPRGLTFPAFEGPAGEQVGHLAFAPDGRRLLIVRKGQAGGGLKVWDATRGRVLLQRSLDLERAAISPHRDLALTPGGRVAGVDPGDRRVVKVWEGTTGAERIALRHPGPVRVVALSPDGSLLACGIADRPVDDPRGRAPAVILWDVSSGKELQRFAGAGHWVDGLAFRHDGRRLAAAFRGSQGTGRPIDARTPTHLLVWDLADRRAVLRLDGVTGMVPCLAFNPSGDRLAVAAYHEGRVYVWDTSTGQEQFRRSYDIIVTSVAFGPDGRRLAVAGWDGLVRVLDAESGHEALTLPTLGTPGTGHYNFTPRAVFSPDGHRLAANDWQGTITIWNAGR